MNTHLGHKDAGLANESAGGSHWKSLPCEGASALRVFYPQPFMGMGSTFGPAARAFCVFGFQMNGSWTRAKAINTIGRMGGIPDCQAKADVSVVRRFILEVR